MAKHFPREKEIRIYSVNDIGTEAHTTGLLSSKNRIRKANSMRVEKILNMPFDWNKSHSAKVCINDRIIPTGKGESTKERKFVIKNRFCSYCSRTPDYYCQTDKNWEFQ